MDEVLRVSNRKDLAETGGGHNQKGVEFQRHWALMRMFELLQEDAPDFLFLFESIQDVAELDSSTIPTLIRIYQVKKKDRNDWSWHLLTKLTDPTRVAKGTKGGKKRMTAKYLQKLYESPFGKLYASVIAFTKIKSSGHFISNQGCELPLDGGANAATSVSCDLSKLSRPHLDLLSNGLATLHQAEMMLSIPDLSRLQVKRVALPPDDPKTHLIGVACKFLEARSAAHAGQARALVDSLIAKIGPLSAKTDTCSTMEEMRRERGYSHSDFVAALGDLESLPDPVSYLDDWLAQLAVEGMSVWDRTGIRSTVTAISRRQLMGTRGVDEEKLINDCDRWLIQNPIGTPLINSFSKVYEDLKDAYPIFKKTEILAHFALRAIKKCAAQT